MPDDKSLWVVFLMAESATWDGRCPFCPETQVFNVPGGWPQEKFQEWLAENHFPLHVDQDARDAGPTPMCNRCSRYARSIVGPEKKLHRKCYEIDCWCACSRRTTHAKETA